MEEYTERDYWLWLTLAFGCSNSRKWPVISHYGSVREACEKVSSGDYSHVLPGDIRTVKSADIGQAAKLAKMCDDRGIGICVYSDGIFPQRLKEIYNPPAVLFYTGDISGIDDSVVISAVGTRHPSEYSVKVGGKICAELASRGVIIASGFAVGLDSVAHNAAMKANGRTIAVLPCGHLYGYPKENAGAVETIVAKGGAVISEYFPDSKPSPLTFRARNRILSGISLGTLIIQTAVGGGSLSTASFALSQGRDIFCIPPHDIYADEYAGVIGLIRDGAKPVFGSADIISEYEGLYQHRLKSDPDLKPQMPKEAPARQKRQKAPLNPQRPSVDISELPEFSPAAMKYGNPDGLFGTKKAIYDLIAERKEAHLDELSVCIADIYELEAFLTELELDGLIECLPGNRFRIRN